MMKPAPNSRSGCLTAGRAVLIALAVVAGTALAAGEAGAFDWPQWRGPNRDSISGETNWQSKWPASGPEVLWTAEVGGGYSAVAVSKGRVYTMGNDGKKDTVWCLDAAKGDVIWKKSYAERRGKYPGPRATPAVDGDAVYTISRQGLAKCYNAGTGEQIWSTNLAGKVGVKVPGWGIAGSPLVLGDRVIYAIGTAGAALNKADGSLLWKTAGGKSSYASPVFYKMEGKDTVLIFGATKLYCVAVNNGSVLWTVPWKTNYDVNAPDPVVVAPDKIFVNSGYGVGSALIQVAGGKPNIVWRKKVMRSQFPTSILYKGHLYGCDGSTGNGKLQCIEVATGKVKWTGPKLGMASPVLAGDKLIVQGDKGLLLVVPATPDAYKPISRVTLPLGESWTMPVLSNGRIYCRSTGRGRGDPGKLICLDVSK